MKHSLLILLLCMTFIQVKAQNLVSGADISWCTEMEADGYTFYNEAGEETDIFALMKEIGMEAIRLRVWVNPEGYGYGAWCDKADVLAKAKRAHGQGLDLMIDFHYSDFFADPGQQNTPIDWEEYTRDQVKEAIASHTTDVLQSLKDEGITPKWVQVGNETNSGMVTPYGAIDWSLSGTARFTNYVELSNVGYDAVKTVFPDATVIIHLGGTENAQWFFPDFIAAGGKVDMIGLSHYPTEAEWNSTNASATHSNINAATCVSNAISQFDLPVMICETGFDVTKPTLASQVMADLFERMGSIEQCAGIFYWEPETDGQWKPAYYNELGWNAYGLGAFTTDGRPTQALNAFGGNTSAIYPSTLSIYATNGQTVMATMQPVDGQDGVYYTTLDVTEPWLNFFVVDTESNIWYGSDPNDKTKLSAADDKWNLWIDSEVTGIYGITVDLANMSWSYEYNPSTGDINDITVTPSNEPEQWYDLYGRRVTTPCKGNIYIIKQGNSVEKIIY